MRDKQRHKQAGFTLIEIMAAFIILGLATGAVISIFGSGSLKIAQMENERKAVLAARSVFALVGNEIPLAAGDFEGRLTDGTHWSARIQPYDLPEQSAAETEPPLVTNLYQVNVRTAAGQNFTSLRIKTGNPP